MSNTVAAILGALVTLLWLTIWSMMADLVPGNIGPQGTLLGIITALVAGLVVYLTFTQQR